jgi:hypothetical protein
MASTHSSTGEHQRLSEIMHQALEEDTSEMKNYHIRRALQYKVLMDHPK